MNIHPYYWQGVPEQLIGDLAGLRSVMEKYGVGQKPVWITEIGWATARPPRFYREVLPFALERAGIDPAKHDVAVVNSPEDGFHEAPNFNADHNLGMFRSVKRITLAELNGLDVTRFPVLVPSASEAFPASELPNVVDYVKRGGTLILPHGLPFYYDMQLNGKGNLQVGDRYLDSLHLAWETWWTDKGVPAREKWQRPAPEFKGKFEVPFTATGRFFSASRLRPGDEFIPIIEAGDENYKGAVCVLYKLNSDLQGNIIAYSGTGLIDSTTEARQAEMLPRTYLIALSQGVQRIFWYNFRAREWKPDEREHHFGIVHANFKPKPAYSAYRTLTTMCPAGSTRPRLPVQGNVYLADWKRPDGKRVHAIWTADVARRITVKITGRVEQSLNHLGEPVPVPGGEYDASPSILYLVGPETVAIGSID